MSISDNQKLDFLWKKLGYGATKTDINAIKNATNEANPSPLLLSGTDLWTDAYQIPSLIPTTSNSIITIYDDTGNGSSTVETTEDTTASPNRTWNTGVNNWIPPQFGSTYQVKVYIAPTGTSNPQASGTQVFAAGSGNNDEWFFDYQSGILNFIGTNLPSGIDGNEIFISGARYVGKTGNRFTALYADSADIGHAFIDSADIDMADIITAYIDSADILHAIIDSADITLGRINTAYIDSADIGHAFIDSAEIGILNITGQINGPETFIIDPAAVGDNTGRVIIKGDLQVDGTETIVNSTTVTVNDKNIVLADSAQDSSQADGAGITVFAANAKITYEAAQDRWVFNKDIDAPAIYADSGIITYLTSTYGTIQYLTSDSATIGNITSTNIDTVNLDADSGTVTNLYSSTGVIVNLTSSNGVITVLASNYADIDSADIDQARILKATVDSAGIQYADIDSADIDVLRVKELTIDRLYAGYADIDSADIDVLRTLFADIDSAEIELARITGLTADSAHITGNLTVGGDLTVAGNATIRSDVGGNIYLGDSNEDNIVFSGDINSHLIPNTTETFDLGSLDKRWRDIYLSGQSVYLGGLILKESDGKFVVYDSAGQLTDIVAKDITGQTLNISDSAFIQRFSADSAVIQYLKVGQSLTVTGDGLQSNQITTDKLIAGYADIDSADIDVLRVGNLTISGDGITTPYISADSADIGVLRIDSGDFNHFTADSAFIGKLTTTSMDADSSYIKRLYVDSAYIKMLEGDSAKFVNMHISGEITGNVGVTGLIPNTVVISDSIGELTTDSALSFGNNILTVNEIDAKNIQLRNVTIGEIFYSGNDDSIQGSEDFQFDNRSSIFGNTNGLLVSQEKIEDSGYFNFIVDKNTGRVTAEGGNIGYHPNRPTGQFSPVYPSPSALDFYGINVDSDRTVFTSQKNIFQTDLTDSQAIALDSFGPEADMIQVKNIGGDPVFAIKKDGTISFTGNLLQNGLPYTGGGAFKELDGDNLGYAADPKPGFGGFVGINTYTPAHNLDVRDGAIYVEGSFTGNVSDLPELQSLIADPLNGFTYGQGSKFLFQPINASLRAGHWDDSAYTTSSTFGNYSVALGRNVRAGSAPNTGISTIAMGDSSYAGSNYSIAIGKNQRTGTGNIGAIAIGTDNILSNNIGLDVTVVGHNNTLSPTANSPEVTIYGKGNTVKGSNVDRSVIVGIDNIVSDAENALVLGRGNVDSASSAILIGRDNIGGNTGAGVIAIGNDNTVSGITSVAIGASNTVSGQSATAIGNNLNVSGDFSVGVSLSGAGFSVTQDNTFAIQGGTVAIGDSNSNGAELYVVGDILYTGEINRAVAGGGTISSNILVDDGAVVTYNPATLKNIAIGHAAPYAQFDIKGPFLVRNENSTTWNNTDDTLPFVMDSTIASPNQLLFHPQSGILRAGNIDYSPNFGLGRFSIGLGNNPNAAGLEAIAIGTNTSASGNNSVAIGKTAVAQGNNGVSIGSSITNHGANGVILGHSTVSYSPNNVIIGNNNTEADSNSVGHNYILGKVNQFSGDNGYILGNNNTIQGSNTYVLGAGVTVGPLIDGMMVLNPEGAPISITSDSSDRILIPGAGTNVGIGKSHAHYRLDVDGDVNFDGTIYLNNVQAGIFAFDSDLNSYISPAGIKSQGKLIVDDSATIAKSLTVNDSATINGDFTVNTSTSDNPDIVELKIDSNGIAFGADVLIDSGNLTVKGNILANDSGSTSTFLNTFTKSLYIDGLSVDSYISASISGKLEAALFSANPPSIITITDSSPATVQVGVFHRMVDSSFIIFDGITENNGTPSSINNTEFYIDVLDSFNFSLYQDSDRTVSFNGSTLDYDSQSGRILNFGLLPPKPVAVGSGVITNITATNPVVVTQSINHDLQEKSRVTFTASSGMTELNGTEYFVGLAYITGSGGDGNKAFALFEDAELTTQLDGTSFSSFDGTEIYSSLPPLVAEEEVVETDLNALITGIAQTVVDAALANAGVGVDSEGNPVATTWAYNATNQSLVFNTGSKNVGIGTDNPNILHKLDVAGNVRGNQFYIGNQTIGEYLKGTAGADKIDAAFVRGFIDGPYVNSLVTIDSTSLQAFIDEDYIRSFVDSSYILSAANDSSEWQRRDDTLFFGTYPNVANVRVGIGTDEPTRKFDVAGATRFRDSSLFENKLTVYGFEATIDSSYLYQFTEANLNIDNSYEADVNLIQTIKNNLSPGDSDFQLNAGFNLAPVKYLDVYEYTNTNDSNILIRGDSLTAGIDFKIDDAAAGVITLNANSVALTSAVFIRSRSLPSNDLVLRDSDIAGLVLDYNTTYSTIILQDSQGTPKRTLSNIDAVRTSGNILTINDSTYLSLNDKISIEDRSAKIVSSTNLSGPFTQTGAATFGSGTVTFNDQVALNNNVNINTLNVTGVTTTNGNVIAKSDVIFDSTSSGIIFKDSATDLYIGPFTTANFDSPNGSTIVDYKIGRSLDSNIERVVDSDYIGTRLQSPWNRIGSDPYKKIYYDEGGPVIIGPATSLQTGDSESKLVLQGGNVLFLDDSSDGDVIASITPNVVPAHGEGPRLMWLPKRGSFRAGYVDNTTATWDDDEVGLHSVAIGKNSRASHFSIALGYDTKAGAAQLNSTGADASRYNSVSVGINVENPAATSVGIGRDITTPTGSTLRSDIVAIGDTITTSHSNQVGIGHNVTLSSTGSHIGIGKDLTSSGTSSGVNIGYDQSTSFSGVAIGSGNTGSRGVAIGQNSSVSQSSSVAIGSTATASSNGSAAIGYSVTSGNSGTTIGKNSSSSTNSVAIGNSITSGYAAVAIGSGHTTVGRSSTVIGKSNTSGRSQTVIGSGNYGTGTGGTIVGSGNQAAISGTAFGTSNFASRGVAIGSGNKATGNSQSVMIGVNNTGSNGTLSVGSHNANNSKSATVFGKSNSNNNDRTIIFGQSNSNNTRSEIFGVSNANNGDYGRIYGSQNRDNDRSYIFGHSNTDNDRASIYGDLNTDLGITSYTYGVRNTDTASVISNYRMIYGSGNLITNSGYAYGTNNEITSFGLAFGTGSTISNGGHAYGLDNTVSLGGIAFGKDNTVSSSALAFGRNNTASGSGIAVGRNSISEGTGISFGQNTHASGTNSIALGNNIVVSGSNSMGIGLGSTAAQLGDSVTSDNILSIMNGTVGIGTSSPDLSFGLHIFNSQRIDGDLYVGRSEADNSEIYRRGERLYNYIQGSVVPRTYVRTHADSSYVTGIIGNQYLINNILPSFNFGNTDLGLVYTGSLDVGIGKSAPNYKLDVNGDINFDGALYLSGTKIVPSIDSIGDVYVNHYEEQYYIDADSAEVYFDSDYVWNRQRNFGFGKFDSIQNTIDALYINQRVDFSFLPDSAYIEAKFDDFKNNDVAFDIDTFGRTAFKQPNAAFESIIGTRVGINRTTAELNKGTGLDILGNLFVEDGNINLDNGNLNITNGGQIFVNGILFEPVSPFIDDGTFVTYNPTGGAPALNVGIGKASPQYSLDVAGDVNVDADDHFRIGGVQLTGNIGETYIIDSAYIQARQLLIDPAAVQALIDSSYVKAFIDSDYIQSRVDSNYIKGFIDSDYIKGFADSDYIKGFVDSNYIKGHADSNYVKTFIDSSYIKLHADSDYVKTFINESYIRSHADSNYVKTFINESYIRSHADSAWITSIADSAYIHNIADESYIRSHADSAWITSIADSDHVKTIVGQSYVRGFIDSAYTNLLTGIGTRPQNFGSNSIAYNNSYTTSALLPNASLFEGMYAYISGTDQPIVSHDGIWNKLARGQDVRITDSVEFAELTITGDLTVLGTRTILNTQTLGIDDPMIHLGKNNETSDAVDIGFIGHYSPDGGTTKEHTGFFRDATNGEYYLFNGLDDAALDDSDPTATVNRTASGFTLATLNVGAISGGYAGFDSDFNAKSTTDLSEGSNLYYTTTRADSAFDDRLLTKTTDNLAEGTNLYYTQGRFDTAFTGKSTTDLSEGTNLYYTNDRVTTHVDSAYVQLRSPQFDYLAVIDSAYVQARQEPGTDSAAVIALINANATLDSAATVSLIDSAYINARVSTVDSAQVLAIVDSDYILSISGSGGSGTGGATILKTYNYVATSGQTTFQDSDTSGIVLEYTVGSQIVTANGITLTSGTDYTATSGSSIVFAAARDSDDEISVITTISSGDAGATGATSTSGFNVTSGSITSFDQTLHNNDFKSIEYVIHMDDSDNSQSQISKVLLTYNKSNVFTTEYGLVNSYSNDSDMGEITAVATASMIQLQLTKSTGTGTVAVKTTKTIIS